MLCGIGASALAFPLMLTTAAHAATFAPEDGLAAIENGDYIDSYPSEFRSQVDPETIWNHDYTLSVDIGPRVAGSPAEDAAAEYVQGKFEEFGFEVERETFSARSQNYADVTPSRYQEGYASWQFRPADNGPFTGPDAPVEGELVDVGNGDDLENIDLTGKIALANWTQNDSDRLALLTALDEAGATAIVLAQTNGSEALPQIGAVPEELTDTVVVSAATNQGERMRDLLEDGPLNLSITTEQSRDTSINVIGTLPAASGDPDAPIVYIGSHIDSVVGSPGASDNGSGSSIMLEVARIISQYDLDVEVRAGAWGAEEIGIVGSMHHVDSLTPEEIDRTIGAWNMDMAGTAYEGTEDQPFGFWALTVDGAAAEENEVLRHANLISHEIGDGDLNIGQVGRSDHQYFHDAGIDAAVFSWMFWAGGTNIVLEPAYHMTTDTLEFVSAERMGYAGEVLGSSAFLAALNEVTVDVVDENGDPAAGVPVAMQCGSDDGWREVGTTDDTGVATTVAPNATCDVVALANNGAEGSALAAEIAGDTTVEVALQVDTEAPVVEIATSPAADSDGVHTESPVEVEITATDDHDPDPAIEYSVNAGEWEPYAGAVSLSDDGVYVIEARATDGFGNLGEAETTVTIDAVADEVLGDPSEGEDPDAEDSDEGDGASPDGDDRLEDTGVDGVLLAVIAAGGLLGAGAIVLGVRRRLNAA